MQEDMCHISKNKSISHKKIELHGCPCLHMGGWVRGTIKNNNIRSHNFSDKENNVIAFL